MANKYIRVKVGDNEIIVADPEELPVSINYSLEDENDFQTKESASALSIEIPAIKSNSQTANTFSNASVGDLTKGESMRNFLPAVIEASGMELLIGKAILKSAKHTNRPLSYTYDFYGDNADWIIDLKEVTLFDLLKHIKFEFTKAVMIDSWRFDGRSENLPYVFAPVRYRDPFDGYQLTEEGEKIVQDDNVAVSYLRPALSKYWILYWGLKSVGYKINSKFLNTNFYRRMTMPWTWGNFLSSEGTKLEIHKFLAKSVSEVYYDSPNGENIGYFDLNVSNDQTDGAYDNNDDYSYDDYSYEMKWQYKAPYYGVLEATFSMQVMYNMHCTGNSSAVLYVQWFKNGVRIPGLNGVVPAAFPGRGNIIGGHSAAGLGSWKSDISEMFCTVMINPGDIISAKILRYNFESKIGSSSTIANVLQFKLDYFRIPVGGLIDFENYTGLKKFKFLDFLKGEVDLYDLSLNTDPISKEVTIEPTHSVKLDNETTPGYFNEQTVNWDDKSDLKKEWEIESINDGEREQIFKFKDDNNDGLLKKINDRFMIALGTGKYVLPERFKAGKKERENRFFSPTMHYDADQFLNLGVGDNEGIAPQFICIVPENISNTSNSESANTFTPKSAYYKGVMRGVGAWKFDGEVLQDFPYMFAVNYKTGGDKDPVLSYSDERVGDFIGQGLLSTFYKQRMANLRNGQRYKSWHRLNNYDVSGLHREFKIIDGNKYELIQINNYSPLKNDSTKVLLLKWAPVEQRDLDSIYPSNKSIMEDDVSDSDLDIKYSQLKCLPSDIPK